MKNPRNSLFLVLISLQFAFLLNVQSQTVTTYEPHKAFIENKGQFAGFIKDELPAACAFSYQGDGESFYLYPGGFSIQLVHRSFKSRSDALKQKRKEQKKNGFKTSEAFIQFEREGNLIDEKSEWFHYTFQGNQPSHRLSGEGKQSVTHSYMVIGADGKRSGINGVSGYDRVVYKELYPGIDAIVEFHPQRGLEYSFRINAAGNPANIVLRCNRPSMPDEKGNRVIETSLGALIEHEAKAWHIKDGSIINLSSSTHPQERTFICSNNKKDEPIYIDPWIQTPSFNTNWDCVWECERDAAGNVYIIGGIMPMQLLKYNASGALQWVYNTPYDTAGVWLGTFATDLAGNSYITSGSPAAIQMVNTSGTLVWNNPNPGAIFSNTEFWNIAFNCDQTKMVVGGTGGFLNPEPYLFDVDMSNGNVLSSQQVTGPGALIAIPPNTNEVRALTATENNQYYFLTHDSIGYITDNLGLCPNTNFPFHVENDNYNLAYKCENFRFDNSGIEAIAYYDNFVFVNRGNRLDKIASATAQVVQSVAIPGGGFVSTLGQNQVQNSGIDIDGCGTIYVGSKNAVYAFNQNLVQTANYSVSFNVYDVAVNSNGEVIACGATGTSASLSRTGYVQAIPASACATSPSVCCDVTVCPPQSLCIGDAPFQLTPNSAGGTWSGTGVSATGVFDPALAGAGSFVVTYTKSCGSDSVVVVVNACSALSVCIDSAGTLNVTGGNGPYTWSYFQPAGSTPITNQAECQACGYFWLGFTCLNGFIPATSCSTAAGFVTWATGASASAPPLFPAQVEDNSGAIFIIDSLGMLLLCGACPASLASVQTLQDPTCFGQTGNVVLQTVSSVNAVTWQPGNLSGPSQSALLAGNYQVFVSDSSGCFDTLSIVINEPAQLILSNPNSISAGCDTATGSAMVQVSGGISPYTAEWYSAGVLLQSTANVLNADTLMNISDGVYDVVLIDGNGCTSTDTIQVASPNPPQLSLLAQADATCGISDGSFSVTVSGNNGPSSLDWYNNGQLVFSAALLGQSDSLVNLGAGFYAVTITDAANCTDSLTVQINNSNAATLGTGSFGALLCLGEDSVGVTLSITGGTAPYASVWMLGTDTIQTDSSAPLSDTVYVSQAGTLLIVVADQQGCSSFETIQLSGPSSAVAITSALSGNASCGASDGTINIIASGGTGALNYSWTPAVSTSNAASALAAGNYVIQITDANGCAVDTTIVISNSDGPVLTVSSFNNPSCAGGTDGSISVTASGGSGSLLYNWTGGGGGSTASGLGSGTYTVTATDTLGCTGIASYTLIDPPSVTAIVNSNPAACGSSNGTAIVAATGGTGPLSYQWSNGATTALATGLSPGTATVVIRDSLNCLFLFDAVVGVVGVFNVDAGDSIVVYAGESGTLEATGPSTADFIWTPNEFVQCPTCSQTQVFPDSSEWYTVLVSLNGCTIADSVWVRVETFCGEASLPTAFSPNDDGMNDEFLVRSRCLKEAEFLIYDRWGRLMFQTLDLSKGWDGTYQGEPVQAGTYAWYLNGTGNNKTVSIKGNVTLLR